ncbi:hypothetical protein GE09DRAFT_1272791 [Coniochaeta sp. 2T2.1]|nr:hypothetical protein GE09DRAFT_1272791 [Coniochaeta sp. 2T2.1]
MAKWRDMPAELRIMVWKLLATDPRRLKNTGQPGRKIYSSCAAVCKEWQPEFEPHNFRQLILTPACIADLNTHVPASKRPLVRHIWLRVELPEYRCASCEDSDAPLLEQLVEDMAQEHNRIFTEAVYSLYRALSSWVPVPEHPGITLELSTHSPSDGEHHFKDRTFQCFEWTGPECLKNRQESQGFLARRHIPGEESDHGWVNGRQASLEGQPDRARFTDAKQKLVGWPLELELPPATTLRTVRVVTGFITRRQFHRFVAPIALREMEYDNVFWSLDPTSTPHSGEIAQQLKDLGFAILLGTTYLEEFSTGALMSDA